MAKAGKLDYVKFWDRVDKLRETKGMTISELTALIGKTGTYLYVARCNNAVPSTETIILMADALGCTTDYLLDHVYHSEELDDPELETFLQMWKTDPKFRGIVRAIMAQM